MREELVLIDTGYAIYAPEMMGILRERFKDWDAKAKRVFITHADVDHCELLSKLESVTIYLNRKSADNLNRQRAGVPDYRENSDLGFGYSKLSRIISGYTPPEASRLAILDSGTPEEHEELLSIAHFDVSGLDFEVLEGSGGHLYGEMVFLCRRKGIVFTGDLLVNISGFTSERAEFNSLAPYLMRSVNIDSQKATHMRNQILELIGETEKQCERPCIICGGHGPISMLDNGRVINARGMGIVEE
jgi:glyoxylase-like metal-dependent hydrolase (beta-lactamase superfamily II)